jgi:hypothetical protein
MGIRKERGFPQQLEKSLAKDARLFHSSHRPNNKDLSIMYCRQRSTLRRPDFGPKDGEHLTADAAVRGATGFLSCAKESITPKESESRRKIVRALMLASLQSAISELQAPAWSCLAEPSLWPDTKRERVSFCCRVLPCDGVSVLLGQRPLSKTLHTHRGRAASFQSGRA